MLVAMQNDHNKMMGLADDVTASGNLEALKLVGQLDADWSELWLLSTAHKIIVSFQRE